MNGNLAINGTNIGGQLYELKKNADPLQVSQVCKKNGLDEVYFSANGKNYVVQGDGLNLKDIKIGALPKAQLTLDGKVIEVQIKAVDNENNTAGEGAKNNIGWGAGLGVTAGLGSAAVIGLSEAIFSKSVLATLGKAGASGIIAGVVVAGATIGVGALAGAFKGQDAESLKPFIEKTL